MHRILERQIKRCLGPGFVADETIQSLLEIINDYYQEADKEQRLLLNALTVSTSELNRINQHVRENHSAMMRTLLNTLSDGVYATNLAGELTLMNSAAEAILGWKESELLGKNMHRSIHYMHADGTPYPSENCPVLSVLTDQRDVDASTFFISRDQRFIPVEFRSRPIYQDEELVGALVSFRDVTDKLAADAKLHLQQAALDSAANMVVIADAQGVIEYVNPSFCRMSGYLAQEVIGQNIAMMNPAQFDQLLPEIVREGANFVAERFCQRKDGSLFEIEMRAAPVRDARLVATHFVMILSDISLRKQAESDLKVAYDRLTDMLLELEFQKFALDQHSIVSITDAEGKISYANQRFCEITQYTQEELLGQNHRILNAEFHPKAFFTELWATITSGKVWHGEIKNRRKEGSCFWVETTIVPFLDQQNRPLRYITIRTDITKRKDDETSLRQSQQRLTLALEGSDAAFWDWDIDVNYLYLSERWAELIGMPPGETLTDLEGFAARIHPDDVARSQSDLIAVLKRETEFYSSEYRVLHSDGHWLWISTHGKVVERSESGRAIRVTGTNVDISERKQAEQALNEAMAAAEAASRAKSDFLANMSHEIRTPMNGIIGMTELALDTELSADQREYLGLVKASADSLLVIVNDILDFSKIEAGKMSIEQIDFNLHELLSQTTRSAALRAHQKGLELLLNIDSALPEMLVGDPGRLRQIVMNLVSNAIKFTSAGEIVVKAALFETSPEGEPLKLHLSVKDTGIGIAQDKFSAIFESFSQADTSTTRKYGGTGLGLTISARLVELMQGTIWLESEVGRGSTFHLVVKLGRSRQPARLPDATRQLIGMRVLVVDDNATNRALTVDLLAHWKMRPDGVSGGQCAIDALEAAAQSGDSYQLILLDQDMPEVNGFDVVEYLRAHPLLAVIPIMMLASGQPGDAERCQALGIVAHVLKPYSQSDLFDAMVGSLSCDTRGGVVSEAPNRSRQNRNSLTILLAEDNAINQTLAVRLLSKFGHQVSVANNGLEAVSQWQTGDFDLILMDVDMPELNGFGATGRIREQEGESGKRIPIIGLTAHALPGSREECLAAGMDGYLSKPIDTEALWRELEGLEGHAPEPLAAALLVSQRRFDLTQALAFMEGDMALFGQIVEIFLSDYPGYVDQLEQAIDTQNAKEIKHFAHTIKGMLSVFAVPEVATLAERIETQVGADHQQNLLELKRALNQLADELKAALG